VTTCDNDEVPIRKGANLWILARTDRDGATPAQVVDTAGAFLARELGGASPAQLRNFTEHIATRADGNEGRFIIGAARPVTVTVSQPEGPSGIELLAPTNAKVLANRAHCKVLRTVQAQRPWIVVARFDWRAPDTVVDWPRRKVNFGAFPTRADHDLDWLLLGAAYLGKAAEPDVGEGTDELSWWGEVTDDFVVALQAAAKRAQDAAAAEARRLLVPVLVGVAVVGGVWLYKRKGRRVFG